VSLILAQPAVSFLLLIFSFGLLYLPMVAIGLVALLGPLAMLIHAGLSWFGRVNWRILLFTVNIWACALIVHVGLSCGQSRWGDVGGTMGAKNMPYAESFLSPFSFILSRVGAS
jgi:hypothetical protein